MSFGQMLWNVEVGGGGTSPLDPYYSPQFLSIVVGDTVRWTNVQGTHNVDGRMETYSGNPESFYSGEPSQGWIFDHVFNIEGDYGFQCNQSDHAQSQFGVIIVHTPNSVEVVFDNHVSVFPNPIEDLLMIETENKFKEIRIYNSQMKLIYAPILDGIEPFTSLSLGHLNRGQYIIRMTFDDYVMTKKLIKL